MIYGAGNAIMDITAQVTDDFLQRHGVEKGLMSLVDLDTSARILDVLDAEGISTSVSAGGSVANTIAGIAALGNHETALFFVVGDDVLGEEFMRQTAASGTRFNTEHCVTSGATGRSIILVTPDGERSMLTHLGVSASFGPEHLDIDMIGTARFGFIEGYLLGTPSGRDATKQLLQFKTAITLSDPRCVEDNKDAFMNALEHVNIVIGNAKEMAALADKHIPAKYKVNEGIHVATTWGPIVVCTQSSLPTLISERAYEPHVEVPVVPVKNVVDTTGAGDQFAAGFLDGLLSGEDLETAAARGGEMAGRVIQHAGARPPLLVDDEQRATPS